MSSQIYYIKERVVLVEQNMELSCQVSDTIFKD